MTATPRPLAHRFLVTAGSVLAVLTVAGCGSQTSSPDDVASGGRGHVVSGIADHLRGTTVRAVLPTGTVTVTVGAPTRRVPADQARDAKAATAPSGTTFLPVHVAFDTAGAPWGGLLAAHPRAAKLSVGVGDRSASLPAPYLVSGGRAIATNPDDMSFVPFPGSPTPSEVTLRLTYDGAPVVVPLTGGQATGRAASLADLEAGQPAPSSCGPRGWALSRPARPEQAARYSVACELGGAGATPYYPGAGWAPEGHEWLVARVSRLAVYDVRSGQGSYRVAKLDDASNVPHAAPDSGLDLDPQVAGTPTLHGTLVSEAPVDGPHRIVLGLRAAGDVQRGSGSATLHLRLTRAVRIP